MAAELTEIERNKKSVPIDFPGISDVSGRAKEIHELIARRAYQLYECRGHADGHDIEDWLQAQSEVCAVLCVGFMELNGDLSVDIGITASELPQLQVRIEPSRLIVSGKKKAPDGGLSQSHADERPRPVEIFDVVDFPVQVEPSGAKATFANGLLEIRIPKAAKRERSLAARAA
jgi:HSP20 family molecular chaperone IbpA